MLPWREWRALLKRTVFGWAEDGAGSMGAALAFYTLFSMAPLLLIAIAIAGVFFGRQEAQDMLLAQLGQLFGHKAASGILTMLQAAAPRREGFLPAILGTVTAIFGAMTVFNELKTDLDRIWRCHESRRKGVLGVVFNRLLSLAMVVVVGVLLLASLFASVLIAGTSDRWIDHSAVAARALEFASSFLVMTGLFAMIYKTLPSTRIVWGDVWVGAAVTSVLFWMGKVLIAAYIGHATVASMSGAAGTVVVVILWVYYSAQIFFLGAEFTREYAHRHGSRQNEPEPLHGPPGLEAANEADIVERARRVVKGEDPVLLRFKHHPATPQRS